ncbi:MAG TPA: DUF4251 domain-containing protein [Puia sp.]|nr:DUF4251 domain-containing protein [Puia sp.]
MSNVGLFQRASFPLLALLVVLPGRPAAQTVKSLVESQNYVFQARTAQPMRGPVRNIATPVYSLQVTTDKIVSDLPYFGRAYIAPMDPTTGPLQFTLDHFDYKLTAGRKGGWKVVIKPKNQQDIQEMELNISAAGYASLQVVSTNRDEISFEGVITAPDKR